MPGHAAGAAAAPDKVRRPVVLHGEVMVEEPDARKGMRLVVVLDMVLER
jgi:hypothetical protein